MRAALRQPAAGQPGGRKGSSAAGVGKTACQHDSAAAHRVAGVGVQRAHEFPQPPCYTYATQQPQSAQQPQHPAMRTELPALASRVDLTMSIRFSGIFWPSTNRSALKNQWLQRGPGGQIGGGKG